MTFVAPQKKAAAPPPRPTSPDRLVETGQEHIGRWTKEEHDDFLAGLKIHGKEWKKVAAAQKYFQKLQKEAAPSQLEFAVRRKQTKIVSITKSTGKRVQHIKSTDQNHAQDGPSRKRRKGVRGHAASSLATAAQGGERILPPLASTGPPVHVLNPASTEPSAHADEGGERLLLDDDDIDNNHHGADDDSPFGNFGNTTLVGHDNKNEIIWLRRYDELAKYKAKHGDTNVPQSQGSLGNWVKTQHQAYKKDRLSLERIEKLEGLGFNWRGILPTWNERLGELAKYKVKHGNTNVPQSQGSLGNWVMTQRAQYNKGKLSKERVQKLDDLGFVWKYTWDERLGELAKYKAEQGNTNVPQSQGSLGNWVITQRTQYKKGKLSKERVQKLDDLGFVWKSRSRTNRWRLHVLQSSLFSLNLSARPTP